MENQDLEIRSIFLEEADELIEQVEAAFLELESGDHSIELINRIFRVAHSFKGSARSVGFDALAAFAHKMEDLLTKLKEGELTPNAEIINVLFKSIDILKLFVGGLKDAADFSCDTSAVVSELVSLTEGGSHDSAGQGEEAEENPGFGFFDDEEVAAAPVQAKSALSLAKSTAKRNSESAQPTKPRNEVIRVSTLKLDHVLNSVGELVVNQTILSQLARQNKLDTEQGSHIVNQMEKIVNEIQSEALSLRMVPVKALFQKLQRAVRDAASTLNKKIDLIIEGDHVELDKVLVEKLTDPLTHLLRNAVDHGIEDTSETRVQNGKDETAKVYLIAEQKDDRAVIHVADDGKGIDREAIIEKAIAKKVIHSRSDISGDEAYSLLFRPGFSTKDKVTEISGRGVGLDVVQQTIYDLKGSVAVKSQLGVGSVFEISVPLSVSIISGIVIALDNQKYIVPVPQLSETLNFDKIPIKLDTQKGRMINLRSEVIPVYSLSEILHKPRTAQDKATKHSSGILTTYNGRKVSFEVDAILGQQKVVLKKLGQEIQGIPGITAGAILANGEPGLVLNLQDLAKERLNYAG